VVGDDSALAGIFGVGVCAAVFTVGDGFGEGSGVGGGFDPVFAARAKAGAALAAALELPLREFAAEPGAAKLELPLRDFAVADRSPEFLLADDGDTFVRLVFELRLDSTLLGGGTPRLEFEAIEELPPATVNTTSSRFECCSTRAVAPGWRRKDTTVLSPLRCVLTSAKARP
jgi:hypothetical protein